ncbi:MAG: carboxypeptidase-like regulatory domain-containing protein [Flavobacteriales bacterium]|nr:carboxypeptidase-like regulatory domain-containing protein [Flavobacteriales bacterium]
MKIQLFIIISFLSLWITTISGQGLLDRKVSFTVKDLNIEETFNLISKSSGIHFAYNPDFLPADSIISYSCQQRKVQLVVTDLIGPSYDFKANGNHVVILRKAVVQKKKKYRIKGTIYDKRTKAPIPSALVYDIRQKSYTRSDQKGKFSYAVQTENPDIILAIRDKGYQDTILTVTGEKVITLSVELQKFQSIPKIASLPANQQSKKLFQDSVVGSYPYYSPVDGMSIVDIFVSDLRQRMAADLGPIQNVSSRFQLSLVPSISTNNLYGSVSKNSLALNLISGYSNTIEGLEIGGFLNIVREDVYGVELAGFQNIVGDRLIGIQAAGFGNLVHGKVVGIQVAGFYNTNRDHTTGMQIAGFGNFSKTIVGPQIAGFINTSTSNYGQYAGFANINKKDAKFMQLAGGFNITKNIRGSQVSGLFNIAKNSSLGQLSGLFNVAHDTCKLWQISSIFNHARVSKGYQIGLFNYADTAEKVGLGLISFAQKGYHVLDISGGLLKHAQLNFKTGSTHKLYNHLSLGRNFDKNLYFLGYGIGMVSQSDKRINFGGELEADLIFNENFSLLENQYLFLVRLQPQIRLSRLVSLFISANYTVHYHPTNTYNDVLEGLNSEELDVDVDVIWSGDLGFRLAF